MTTTNKSLLASTLATTSDNMTDVHLETQENPNQSIEKTKKLLRDGCACSYGSKGGPCSREFQEDTVLSNMNNCLKLTSGELDLVILANIQAFTCNKSTGSKRSRSTRCNFQFHPSLFAKTCVFIFTASVILDFVVSKSITGNMDSFQEPMATVKGCRVTPFLSELRRMFTIFLPITWRRTRLSYLEGYRDSSEMMSKCCPQMKQRLVSTFFRFSDTLGYASCATFLFLPHFDVICDLLLNRRTATWNLFVK